LYLFASLLLPGLTAVFLLITPFTYIWYKKHLRLLDMSTETTGVITKLTETKPNPRNPDAEQFYRLWAEYTVDGRTYKTYMQREISKATYQQGQEITIIYDPDKPSRAVPKDFDGAKRYWVSFPLIMLCFSAVFVLFALYSLPDVLEMSDHSKIIYKIVFNFTISAGIIAAMIAFSRSDCYRREKEKNPRSARATLLMAIPILGKLLVDAISDLIFYVILK